ncbi:MAG: RsmD family RNA methyltransferase, partial [Anaerolineae bacterium]
IEALSRGAARAVFVEKNPKAIATIRTNLQRTRLKPKAQIVQADVFGFLAGEPEPFDVVYIAPPQYQGLWSKTLITLEQNPGWLAPAGLVIVQIFPKEFEPVGLNSLELIDERKYGSTLVCFYEHREQGGAP